MRTEITPGQTSDYLGFDLVMAANRPEPWLSRMMDRKPLMLVAVALANKMARTIWAMQTKKEDYRDAGLAAA